MSKIWALSLLNCNQVEHQNNSYKHRGYIWQVRKRQTRCPIQPSLNTSNLSETPESPADLWDGLKLNWSNSFPVRLLAIYELHYAPVLRSSALIFRTGDKDNQRV